MIDCGNLPNPENGLVAITRGVVAETGVGALATYTCSEGYGLQVFIGDSLFASEELARISRIVFVHEAE